MNTYAAAGSRAILQRTMVDSRRSWPLKLATCEILYLHTLEKNCAWSNWSCRRLSFWLATMKYRIMEQSIIGILAHQNVRKLDANIYTTSMDGLKYKLAHKRVGINRWSLTENAQREQLIKILEGYIVQLKREMVNESAQNFVRIVESS
jgi:hypothetical protein